MYTLDGKVFNPLRFAIVHTDRRILVAICSGEIIPHLEPHMLMGSTEPKCEFILVDHPGSGNFECRYGIIKTMCVQEQDETRVSRMYHMITSYPEDLMTLEQAYDFVLEGKQPPY